MLEAARLNTIQEVVFARQSDSSGESSSDSDHSEGHEDHLSESEKEWGGEEANDETEVPTEELQQGVTESEPISNDGLRIRKPENI